MFTLPKTFVSIVTLVLATVSTAAYCEISPITGSYVALNIYNGIDLTNNTDEVVREDSLDYIVPSGKKLIVRTVRCRTEAGYMTQSLALNDQIKARLNITGLSTKHQNSNGYITPYGKIPVLESFGSLPSLTSQANFQGQLVFTAGAKIQMSTRIYNADQYTVAEGEERTGAKFTFYCSVQGNLYSM